MLHPQGRSLLELVRQPGQLSPPLQAVDGLNLALAAWTALSTLATSQFSRRFTPFIRFFSTLAFITSMAARGAPMVVRTSAMTSLCLK